MGDRRLGYRHAAIFVTGGATLALELVASRALTPYFGVSLFIWTGILSTTLACLGLGYWLGGRAGRSGDRAAADSLFGAAPAAAGTALGLATAVYPLLFPELARTGLALGSILASALLLGPALILLSAMNPLLVVALRRPGGQAAKTGRVDEAGDAGAGAVFAWSTFGSVAGVIVAAFALIPNLTNYRNLLLIAAVLAAISAFWALATHDAARPHRRRAGLLAALCLAVTLAAFLASLLMAAEARRPPENAADGAGYSTVAVVPSWLATLKIVDIGGPDAPPAGVRRYLLADGMNMGAEDLTGRPTVAFAYALAAIAFSHPGIETALVLGLGIGSTPELLADRGVAVEVVEISRPVIEVAERHFGFAPERFVVHEQDARLFARTCPRRYDAILMDLFSGDGIPEHLVTREFFGDLKANCLAEGGVVGFNALTGPATPPGRSPLVATIVDSFGPAAIMLDIGAGAAVGNAYIAVPAAPRSGGSWPAASADAFASGFAGAPEPARSRLRAAFAAPVTVGPADIAGVPPLTDGFNLFAYSALADHLAYRRSIVRALPPALLVN